MPERAAKDLVVEIGTEELPATFIPPALDQMRAAGVHLLGEHRLAFHEVLTYGTPRRLVLTVRGLATRQTDRETVVTGPPRAAAYDTEGKPTAAARGFARAHGVAVGRLTVKTTPRGDVAAVVKRERGRAAESVLRGLLPTLIGGLTFPKTMRWDASGVRFARPIRRLMALHGARTIRFSYAGLASGNRTVVARQGSARTLAVASAEAYRRRLAACGILVDPAERTAKVARQLTAMARRLRGGVVPEGRPELLERVVFETENPVVMAGRFEKSYLQMPREVVIAIMRENQAYFAIQNRQGALLPAFLCILNHRPGKPAVVRRGHERVLRARLDDARFYFEKDQQVKLADRVERLKGVVEHERLGSLADKTERLQVLVGNLADRFQPDAKTSAVRAAFLAKADLLTGMVGELPALQGIVGGEYARLQGETPEVADAIAEHYRPRYAGDRLPRTPAARLLAVADKLDMITGFFGIGLIPTGSEDPYALRRHGLGMIQIMTQAGWGGSIRDLVSTARQARDRVLLASDLPIGHAPRPADEVVTDVVVFLRTRADSLLRQEGASHDSIECVLSAEPPDSDDLVHAVARIRALEQFRKRAEWEPLLTAYRRARSIAAANRRLDPHPDKAVFTEPAEQRLYDAYRVAKQVVTQACHEHQYEAALAGLARLTAPINAFFEDVLVMAPDDEVRHRRLSLLNHTVDVFEPLGQFTRLVTDGRPARGSK